MNARARASENRGWLDLASRSQSLRRNLESLVREIQEKTPADTDAVSGWSVLDGELRRWREVVSSAGAALEARVAALESERNEQLEYLEEHLRRELTRRGLSVVGDTTPLVIDGVVHVEIDKKKPSVSVNGEASEDLSIPGLARAIEERADRLKKDAAKPGAFLELLAEAYDRELRAAARPDAKQVQTLQLLPHLLLARQSAAFRANPSARNFREYTREQFRADMYQLLSSGAFESGGRRFRYASGSDTQGALFMLVPALGRMAHVGRIWFEGV